MEQLGEISKTIMEWLASRGFGEQQLQLLVLLIAVIALIAAVGAMRRARDVTGGVTLEHMRDKLDRAMIQVGDVRGRLEAENAKLKEKVLRLEQELAALRESADKKKPLEPEVTPLPEPPQEPSREPVELPIAASVSVPEPEPELAPTSIFSGLKKTRDAFFTKLSTILGRSAQISEATIDELEELLIGADLGVRTTQHLLGKLKERVKAGEVADAEDCKRLLKEEVRAILERPGPTEISAQKRGGQPQVILVVGVNGVGKTTTIGKLAGRFSNGGAKVLLGAADTFRAAAAEQIEIWAERAGVEVLRGAENAKPSTVAYEAVHKGIDGSFDVVIVDTAGRLHTRVNLMNELGGVIDLINREQPGAPHETILVVDATTGQNALEQAREFHQRAKLTGVIVTKLDGTPKGGIVVGICNELGIPVRYVGVGESAADLKPFDVAEFTEALFAEGETSDVFQAAQPKAAVRAVRRRGNS